MKVGIYKITIFLICAVLIIILYTIHCYHKCKIIVCPQERANQFKQAVTLSDKRELLYDLDYEIVLIKKTNHGFGIVQIYRRQHTTSSKYNQLNCTFETPSSISTVLIFNPQFYEYGVAVKRKMDKDWRVYWMKEGINYFTMKEVILPDYKELPLLK